MENVSGGYSKGCYGYFAADEYGNSVLGFKNEEDVQKYEQRREKARKNQLLQNAMKFFQNIRNN